MEDLRTKYRPQNILEVWGNDRVKTIWNGYLRRGYFPKSIILHSDFGIGKSTIARIFMNDIINFEKRVNDREYSAHEYNSPTSNFESIQKWIQQASNFVVSPIRVLFFDEAQRMPAKAQDGFLKQIEDIRDITFIFATTDIRKIDGGLFSRSDIYKLRPPSKDILIRELEVIAGLEKIKIRRDTLEFLIEFSEFSPRKCLGNLQIVSHYEDNIDIQTVKELLD